jgi:hypothetical protein
VGPEYHCKDCAILLTYLPLIVLLQIARINGSSQIDDRIVIVGAHQDRQVVCLRAIMIPVHVTTVPLSGLSKQLQVSVNYALVDNLAKFIQVLTTTALARSPSLSPIVHFLHLVLLRKDRSSFIGTPQR